MPNIEVDQPVVPVVAAIIVGQDGRLLLSKRLKHQHQGDKWEFPGGKLEAGEIPQQAIIRELYEELGIIVQANQIRLFEIITHAYSEKTVQLMFWLVLNFEGLPVGKEGQTIGWFGRAELVNLVFPEANQPIVERLLSNTNL